MRRERIAEDIYVFTSELYAQVTAGAVVTSQGTVLIDTMVFPEEARTIRRFVEERLHSQVRYIINTHYHADHTYGNCFFENAIILGHQLCYDLMDTNGRRGLEGARQNTSVFDAVKIQLPHLLFNERGLALHLGDKTLELTHSPGHSPDSLTVLVKEDRVLFAGDTLMAIPYFVDGDFDDLGRSLLALKAHSYENIIQGHGEIVLRGEIEDKINEDLTYLQQVHQHVLAAMNQENPYAYLQTITCEAVGKSRILLNGEIELLHQNNMRVLYERLRVEK